MVTRFLDAGHRAAWAAGDEVYGGNPRLRAALEERGNGYVLDCRLPLSATDLVGMITYQESRPPRIRPAFPFTGGPAPKCVAERSA